MFESSTDDRINFVRLKAIAKVALGYSLKETRLLLLKDIFEQHAYFMELRGMSVRNNASQDEIAIPEEVI